MHGPFSTNEAASSWRYRDHYQFFVLHHWALLSIRQQLEQQLKYVRLGRGLVKRCPFVRWHARPTT